MIKQPLITSIREKGKRFELLEDYTYKNITVPKGFKTDGASVPRFFMAITGFERRGYHDPAWLIHDWLYENKGVITHPVTGRTIRLSRKECDEIFFNILKELNIMDWHCKLAYTGVRAGGFIGW